MGIGFQDMMFDDNYNDDNGDRFDIDDPTMKEDIQAFENMIRDEYEEDIRLSIECSSIILRNLQ
jgi:hypothetical protein